MASSKPVAISFIHMQVEERFTTKAGLSWNRAMDEIRIDRLLARHGRDTLCVIIRDWPANKRYKDSLTLVASLEYLVCVI